MSRPMTMKVILVYLLIIVFPLGSIALGLDSRILLLDKDAVTVSELLIKTSLERYSQVGDDSDVGRFMASSHRGGGKARAVLGSNDKRDLHPYISHYNGQYEAGRFIIDGFGVSGTDAYKTLRLISILASAAVISIIVIAVLRDFGAFHAMAALAPFILSPMFLQHASLAHWQIYLSLFPFAVVMLTYPVARNSWKFALLSMLVAILVFIKSLTGYEYLTSITLACMVPIFYHEIKSFGYTGKGFVRFATRSFVIGLSCVTGFALALFLHLEKMAKYFGDFNMSFDGLRVILAYTIFDNENGLKAPVSFGHFVIQQIENFLIYNFFINLTIMSILLLFLFMFWYEKSRVDLRKIVTRYLGSALFGATLLSVIASVSWSLVMVKHATFHPYLNWIQNYLCAYIFISISLAQIFSQQYGARKLQSQS